MRTTVIEERSRFERLQAEHFASADEVKFWWQTRDPYLARTERALLERVRRLRADRDHRAQWREPNHGAAWSAGPGGARSGAELAGPSARAAGSGAGRRARRDLGAAIPRRPRVDPEGLPKFYRAIADCNGEFVNGSRMVYPMERQAMRILNLIGNKVFSAIFTWLLEQRLRDTLCGTKAFLKRDHEKIKAGRSYFGEFDPFGDFDLLFGAAKQNLKIVEVPVRYRDRTYSETKIKQFRHGLLLLRMCWIAFKRFQMY